MKNISKLILLAASLLLFEFSYAQSEGFDRTTVRQLDNNLEAKATHSVRGGSADAELKIKKPDGYPAKDIPKEYTGFRIEIMVTDSLVPETDDLFFRHGNIMLEPLNSNRFAYTVGDFRDAEAATSFLQQFILPKYSEASVIQYKDGKRN